MMATTTIIMTPASLNTTSTNLSLQLMFFCGVPGFCGSDTREFCADIPISVCPRCNVGSGIFFVIVVFFLFLVVILGNASVQACFFANQTMRTKMDYVRLSLSISDMLTGLQLALVMIPNMIRTFNLTQNQLDEFTFQSTNNPATIICGCWLLLSFTSSMYHMVLLSGLRLVAVTQPLKYKLMQDRWIYISIGAVWVLAILTATVPTFPFTPVTYTYFQSAFVYLPSRPFGPNNTNAHPNFLLIVSVLFPYVCVMIIIPTTAIILKVKRRKSEAVLNQHQKNSKSYQREMKIVWTLAIMFFSYAASILPLLVILTMINQGNASCLSLGTATMVTVVLAWGNSLVNVIVYAARDQRFREGLWRLVDDKCPVSLFCLKRGNPDLNTTAADRQGSVQTAL